MPISNIILLLKKNTKTALNEKKTKQKTSFHNVNSRLKDIIFFLFPAESLNYIFPKIEYILFNPSPPDLV